MSIENLTEEEREYLRGEIDIAIEEAESDPHPDLRESERVWKSIKRKLFPVKRKRIVLTAIIRKEM